VTRAKDETSIRLVATVRIDRNPVVVPAAWWTAFLIRFSTVSVPRCLDEWVVVPDDLDTYARVPVDPSLTLLALAGGLI
jgi:hypothetical protein